MARIGERLREIRQQWGLSLREVEQRSRRIARGRGDTSYQLSASWLQRLESDEHELTVKTLIALAEIYSIPTDQLIHDVHSVEAQALILNQPGSPNATISQTAGARKSSASPLFAATQFPDPSPGKTTLIPAGDEASRTPFMWGIIGTLDMTLDPMIPAGSIVQIDTRSRNISSIKDWTHEFQRPIYFLTTHEGYVCGWCELDTNSQWLTLIPHPLSPASSRRWKYQTEIENIGRVTNISIRLGESV
jgi:transcriptional regulator with XRE-family HTH domain